MVVSWNENPTPSPARMIRLERHDSAATSRSVPVISAVVRTIIVCLFVAGSAISRRWPRRIRPGSPRRTPDPLRDVVSGGSSFHHLVGQGRWSPSRCRARRRPGTRRLARSASSNFRLLGHAPRVADTTASCETAILSTPVRGQLALVTAVERLRIR